jgi:hypothetical protein
MPTARELLEQADALMRRNRARQVDTEIPELTEVIPMPVVAPELAQAPVALADIPELTDAVEEIEIASIVEIPDDDLESNDWLRADAEELAAEIVKPVAASAPQAARVPEPIGGRVLPLFAVAGRPHESAVAAPAPASPEANPVVTPIPEPALAKASVVELPVRDPLPAQGNVLPTQHEALPAQHDELSAQDDALPAQDDRVAMAPEQRSAANADTEAAPPSDSPSTDTPDAKRASAYAPGPKSPGAADDWARWAALAEEIRMQVLQRVDIFTDTGLREQLSVLMQPIVERASAEMIETINTQVGMLLRAYIADAIEREIEKWREGNT